MEKNFVLRIFLITSFLVFLILIFFKFTNKEQSIKQEVEKIEDKIEGSNLVKEIMTKNPIGIDNNELAAKALSLMNTKKITSLCVYNKKNKLKTIGVLHIHNILQSNIS